MVGERPRYRGRVPDAMDRQGIRAHGMMIDAYRTRPSGGSGSLESPHA
ncbi:MAG: hypothetical protein ACK56F_05735 [bacterium]